MTPVAVIILNWNGAKLLREFLPTVIANTNPAIGTIIIADNGSTDDSVEVLQKDFAQVQLLQFDKNYGFAEGYNRAIRDTGYEYTVLLNSDVAPNPRWLDILYEYMSKHQDVGACQPKILSYKESDKFEYAGACGGFLDKNGYAYCRGRIFDTCETDNGQYDSPISIFWATGAALMIRTNLYLDAGGLDPDFFAHMEEIDLCWRINILGYSIVVVPQSVVRHLGGGSLPASNPRKTYLNFRNNLLMMHKNLPDSTRKRKIFRRMLLDGIAAFKFAASLDFANVKAIFKAHCDFRKMRKKYTKHPSVDLLDQRDEAKTNILIDYFLKGKKHYSQLKSSTKDSSKE